MMYRLPRMTSERHAKSDVPKALMTPPGFAMVSRQRFLEQC